MFQYLLSLFVFVLTLGVLVVVHELGHFLSAKLFGVRVDEFGFGLPPRIWGKKKGETIYSINAIPAGGFVKLTGEEEDVNDPRSFSKISAPKRAIVVVSGVVMNFVTALLIFAVIYFFGGPINSEKVIVDEVSPESPAAQAGLKEGDYIVTVNSNKAHDQRKLGKIVRELAGTQVSIVYERENQTYTTQLTPRKDPPPGQGPLGISTLPDVNIQRFPIYQAPFVGARQALKFTSEMIGGLGDMVNQIFVKREAPEDVGGIIRIGYMTHKATEAGWQSALMWAGLLSLNLAILNILPLPALDGGRLVFITIEALTRRKVPARVEKIVHATGMVLLLTLVVFVTYKDVIWVWANTSIKDKVLFLLPH